MNFEIDVSGEDLLNKGYTIVLAERDNNKKESVICGFKFKENLIQILRARHGQLKYKYKLSQSQKALFKIRLCQDT